MEPTGLASELAEASDIVRQGERSKRRRRRLRAILLILGALMVLLELGLRWSSARAVSASKSPLWTVEPWAVLAEGGLLRPVEGPLRYGLSPDFVTPDDGPRVSIVEPGLRGPALGPRREDERRILLVGDGYAFGPACNEDETLGACVAAALGPSWRAWTAAAPGYTAPQIAAALREYGVAVQPDLVLVYLNTSDADGWGHRLEPGQQTLVRDLLPLPDGLRDVLRHSHLYAAIVRAHLDLVLAGPAPQFEDDVPFAPGRADQLALAVEAVADMQRASREHGWPLLLLHQPILPAEGALAAPARAAYHALAEGLAPLGIPTLGLLAWSAGPEFAAFLLDAAPRAVSDDLSRPLAPAAYADLARRVVAALADAELVP